MPIERDVVEAVLEDKASRCPKCGYPLDETYDPELERDWVVDVLRCHACGASESESEKFRKSKTADLHGLHLRVFRELSEGADG